MVESALLVGFGGAIGALGRYGIGTIVRGDRFPLAIFVVNVVGSFLLGLVTFAGVGESILLFVGIGACGAFTTFSTFSVDTVRLVEDGHTWIAVGYALGTILAAVTAVGIAWFLVG